MMEFFLHTNRTNTHAHFPLISSVTFVSFLLSLCFVSFLFILLHPHYQFVTFKMKKKKENIIYLMYLVTVQKKKMYVKVP